MRTYRASSLGSCTRAQITAQLGMAQLATPDKMQAIYDRGNDHEAECVAAMRADEWIFLAASAIGLAEDENQPYIELEVAEAKITGHLDGLAYPPDFFGESPPKLVEIKSPISFAKWERAHKTGDYSDPLMNRYAWQISVYMAATGLEAVVACVEDGQVRTFGIEVAPHNLAAITLRVGSMENAVKAGAVPAACSQLDYPCPVAYLHDQREVVEDEVLDAYLSKYAAAKAVKDDADEAMKLLRSAIDSHMGLSDSLSTVTGTATRVTSTRTTVDWKAAEAAGIDLTPFKKESASTSIRITPKDSSPDSP